MDQSWCAHEQRDAVHASLRKGHVDLSGDFVGNTLLANVADHTDNRPAQTFRLFTTKRDTLAEQIAIRKESIRKRLVDDRHLLPVFTVARVVLTTASGILIV